MSRYSIDKLIVAQKIAIRAINGLGYNDHTIQYFAKNEILKFEDLYTFQICNYLYKAVVLQTNNNSVNYISKFIKTRNRNSRLTNCYILPLFKRSKSHQSFIFNVIKSWNSLDMELRNASNKTAFKRRELKCTFFHNYNSL